MHSNSTVFSEKSLARQYLLSKRLSLSDQDRLKWDTRIFDHLLSAPFFQEATRIACYFSHLNEPHLVPFMINYLKNRPKETASKLFYLPILKKSEAGRFLIFGPCTPQTQYKNNLYGIPEPDSPNECTITAPELDLILMPLVGFTAAKNRLGMGGGFYDQTLSFKLKRPNIKPCLVGIAYACQELEVLPIEPHDIALNHVITEHKIY